jgi:hypothetical protein
MSMEIVDAIKALEGRLTGISGVNYLGEIEIGQTFSLDNCPGVALKLKGVGKFTPHAMPTEAFVDLEFTVKLFENGEYGEYNSDNSRGSMVLFQKVIAAIMGGATGDTVAAMAWYEPPTITPKDYIRNVPAGIIEQELKVVIKTAIFDTKTL